MNTAHGRTWLGLSLALGALTAVSVQAEEGGSGHYTPGATADYLDALPGYPCLAIEDVVTYYGGDVSGNVALPVGGHTTLGLNAKAYSEALVGFYETPWTFLGGNYAAGVGVPYVWMNAKAQIGHFTVEDSANGIGDIEIMPFILGWTNGTDLKYDVRLNVFAPTGNYEKGALANPGKNYWTFEPAASISYISSKIGLEASAFAGVDFNTENHATDYQSGDVFHLDATLAEHLPLFGGAIGVGANGFYYQQFTEDSGSGAVLGGLEDRTVGVGPVLSYVRKIGKFDLAAEVKWLPEIAVQNRLKGNYIWFKLAVLF
jgi:hypothetical protein